MCAMLPIQCLEFKNIQNLVMIINKENDISDHNVNSDGE